MKSISKIISQKQTKNIEATFLDMFGKARVLTFPKSRFKEVQKAGHKCDGSSICGQHKITDSDMKFFLDSDACYVLPNGNAVVFCDTDFEYDARANLKKIEKELKQKKILLNFGAELEFFLFDDENIDNFSEFTYFEYSANKQYDCLNKILLFCEKSDIEIEAFHHECGTNQFELDFKYDSPTKTADRVVYLKKVIEHFAKQHNLNACFLPKPIKNTSGSGMHVNISAYWEKRNLFYDKNDALNLSQMAYKFIEGVFGHIGGITAFANPTQNSYDRLNSGFEAPNKVKYSSSDRSALVRIPKANKSSTRIELRSPDISCNPYLTFLAIIKASFEFLLNDSQKDKCNSIPKTLPKNLKAALKKLKSDECLNSLVPKEYIKTMLK